MAANNDVKENEITQASAQATLANLKEVRVVLNDGSSKAYGKEDFLGVIAAGIKTYFQSIAASGITGFLTTDSGKGGISTPADAASVLGGAAVIITGGSDLNNYTNDGIYIYESGATPLNCPTAYAFRMEVLKINSVRKVQIIIDAQNKKWCRRGVSGDFSAYSWERVYDESILTDNAVLAELKAALATV